METFQKEITFLSKVAVPGTDNSSISWQNLPTTKTATFKELIQTERDQHKLHFKIISVFRTFKLDQNGQVQLDDDGVYELTTLFIEKMLITDESFSNQDLKEFLNDSAALFSFGFTLLSEKISPFFLKLTNGFKN